MSESTAETLRRIGGDLAFVLGRVSLCADDDERLEDAREKTRKAYSDVLELEHNLRNEDPDA